MKASSTVSHARTLFLLAALLAALVPAEALRTTRPEVVSIEPSSFHKHLHQRRKEDNDRNPIAFLVSVPRGGADASAEASTESNGGVKEEVAGEVEEPVVEEEEEEEVVEEVEEEIEAEEDAVAVAEEEDEEVEVVYPTEEIPSDDVQPIHTTDGELADGEFADDEGVYTDGQNESPIAAADTAEGGDDGDDDEEVEDPSSEATAVTDASVAVIDDELKKVLMADLKYTEDDVSNMRPDIAEEVVLNKLTKPIEGMPKNWYVDPDARTQQSPLSKLLQKKALLVSVAVVGAAAVAVGTLKDNDAIGDTIEDIVDAILAIPKSLAGLVIAAKSAVLPKKKPKLAAAKNTVPQEEVKENMPETKIAAATSIKPGTTPKDVPDPEADYTWLDKGLTKIGAGFKSFLNMKI